MKMYTIESYQVIYDMLHSNTSKDERFKVKCPDPLEANAVLSSLNKVAHQPQSTHTTVLKQCVSISSVNPSEMIKVHRDVTKGILTGA